jgi:hypothetical protein
VEDLHYGNFHVGTQPSFLRQIPSGPLLNEFHSHEQQISTVGLPKPHSVPIPSSLETAATTHRLHFLRIVPSLQDAPSYPTRHNEPVPPFSSSLPIPYKHKDHIRSSTSCNPPPLARPSALVAVARCRSPCRDLMLHLNRPQTSNPAMTAPSRAHPCVSATIIFFTHPYCGGKAVATLHCVLLLPPQHQCKHRHSTVHKCSAPLERPQRSAKSRYFPSHGVLLPLRRQ